MKSPYTVDEQETTINMFPANVSESAEIYTCIPFMMQRLLNLRKEYPEDVALIEGDGYIDATVPRSWIKIQPKRKCNLSDERRKEIAANLNAAKQAKKEAQQDASS